MDEAQAGRPLDRGRAAVGVLLLRVEEVREVGLHGAVVADGIVVEHPFSGALWVDVEIELCLGRIHFFNTRDSGHPLFATVNCPVAFYTEDLAPIQRHCNLAVGDDFTPVECCGVGGAAGSQEVLIRDLGRVQSPHFARRESAHGRDGGGHPPPVLLHVVDGYHHCFYLPPVDVQRRDGRRRLESCFTVVERVVEAGSHACLNDSVEEILYGE